MEHVNKELNEVLEKYSVFKSLQKELLLNFHQTEQRKSLPKQIKQAFSLYKNALDELIAKKGLPSEIKQSSVYRRKYNSIGVSSCFDKEHFSFSGKEVDEPRKISLFPVTQTDFKLQLQRLTSHFDYLRETQAINGCCFVSEPKDLAEKNEVFPTIWRSVCNKLLAELERLYLKIEAENLSLDNVMEIAKQSPILFLFYEYLLTGKLNKNRTAFDEFFVKKFFEGNYETLRCIQRWMHFENFALTPFCSFVLGLEEKGKRVEELFFFANRESLAKSIKLFIFATNASLLSKEDFALYEQEEQVKATFNLEELETLKNTIVAIDKLENNFFWHKSQSLDVTKENLAMFEKFLAIGRSDEISFKRPDYLINIARYVEDEEQREVIKRYFSDL